MTNETKEALARSLSANTTGRLPFLPYLPPETRVLDWACGKGAVSGRVAERLISKLYD